MGRNAVRLKIVVVSFFVFSLFSCPVFARAADLEEIALPAPQTGRQDFVRVAPVVLIYVADHARMSGSTAGEKEFYGAVDTGFISQNVYLYCASQDLATVVLGWVDKLDLKKAMDLRQAQRIILTQPVGYPK